MPTYSYKCNKCDHKFEERQGYWDEALTKCPQCKKNALKRIIGVPIVFVKQAPKTLGELAEANSKKFGREECQERELRAKEEYEKAKEKLGVKKKKAKETTPWWRSGTQAGLDYSEKPLNPQQVEKYKEQLSKEGVNVNQSAAIPKRIRRKKNASK